MTCDCGSRRISPCCEPHQTKGRVEKVRFAVVDVSYCSSFVELAAVENWYFSTGPTDLRFLRRARNPTIARTTEIARQVSPSSARQEVGRAL